MYYLGLDLEYRFSTCASPSKDKTEIEWNATAYVGETSNVDGGIGKDEEYGARVIRNKSK